MYKCINKLAPDYLADNLYKLPYPQSKHQIP